MTAAATHTFYKLDVQGIVYLIDPASSIAYTYDLESPTKVGTIQWDNPTVKPILHLYSNWETVLAAKMSAHTAACANTAHDATPTSTII
jgi:hypothetical protein